MGRVFRKDYTPPAWWIDRVDLAIDLSPSNTVVDSRLCVRRNHAVPAQALVLDGEALETLSVFVNGQAIAHSECLENPGRLVLSLEGSDEAIINTRVRCVPETNKSLDGLFMSNGGFFTQCEPEGFRRITWFLDRPDVLSRYRVRIQADAQAFPVLLSNGHLCEAGPLPNQQHYVLWEDPFPKPCYLFALVAARLSCLERRLTTRSGREVLLQVWVEEAEKPRAGFALDSLEAALRWDERRFGLELDLDRYMIVATHDFNLGAMENKGLNLFNAQYVLADPETATDTDFANIESIIAHEYFHNWTGNRVTCKSWFELTLKEGLTVFRDQCFSADRFAESARPRGPQAMASARAVKRIEDLRFLQAVQFSEDEGPMCHAVRPDSYEEINNFYTATVYEKGAELIAMLQSIVGEAGFARGLAHYLSCFDGQAVDCEAFIRAMSEANQCDLSPFMAWYDQAGGVCVTLNGQWMADTASYRLECTQSQARAPNAPPLMIPLALGFLTQEGQPMPVRLAAEKDRGFSATPPPLVLRDTHETWVFEGVITPPILSVGRHPVPPVRLRYPAPLEALFVRLQHDCDPCAQWEAGQALLEHLILGPVSLDDEKRVWTLWSALLHDKNREPAFKAVLLTPPPEKTLFQKALATGAEGAHPRVLRTRLIRFFCEAGTAMADQWAWAFAAHAPEGPWEYTPYQAGQRALRHLALRYLCAAGIGHETTRTHFQTASNMTDRMGALVALLDSPFQSTAHEALHAFEARHADHSLVMNKWFLVQAKAWRVDPLTPPVRHKVMALLSHKAFDLANPNRVQALLGSFFRENPGEFHDDEGLGYALWAAKLLEIDRFNPQQAARLARSLENKGQYPAVLQARLAPVLDHLLGQALSPNLAEILHRMQA